MGIKIVALSEYKPSNGYHYNLAYLLKGVQAGRFRFQGDIHSYASEKYVFNNSSVSNFTRSANPKIRGNITTYLRDVLPGITIKDLEQIEEAFGFLFMHCDYEWYLDQDGKQRSELMKMLIFNEAQNYVAHVDFKSFSRRSEAEKFTVDFALTCQRFTYFPLQETDFAAVPYGSWQNQQMPMPSQTISNEFPAQYVAAQYY